MLVQAVDLPARVTKWGSGHIFTPTITYASEWWQVCDRAERIHSMKLSAAAVQQTVDQFDAQPIPDHHPAVPQLNSIFGEHTFFLHGNGLLIVEPAEPTPAGDATGQVVKLAGWQNEERTSLVPQAPEPTGVVVVLEPAKPDGAA
jgi:hypothetical protein